MSSHEMHRVPSEIDDHRSWFDELAAKAEDVVSRDIFFLIIAVLILAWVPTYFLFDSVDHWHLTFVVPAEIVTLLMVVLLANHDRRSEQALHRKTDAIASALAVLVENSGSVHGRKLALELRAAHGLEDRESTEGD